MSCFDIRTKLELAKLLRVGAFEIDSVIEKRGHYYRPAKLPKTDGSYRMLNVPCGPLKLLQQKIKRHILDSITLFDCVHGGVLGRSVVTNARPHTKKQVVFTLDLKDFFPSVSPGTVQKIFAALGFSAQTADLLVRITTWDQQLPQGAPTSPGLANLSMMRVDVRLSTLAKKRGFTYTRYVDDLAFSGNERLMDFRRLIQRIVEDEGFSVNPAKICTMHAGMRQTVAKVVVNKKPNLPREKRRSIRQQVLTFASTPVRFRNNSNEVRGQLSWLSSVNPQLGFQLRKQIGKL
jgi:RNA-directed DNA polymerase